MRPGAGKSSLRRRDLGGTWDGFSEGGLIVGGRCGGLNGGGGWKRLAWVREGGEVSLAQPACSSKGDGTLFIYYLFSYLFTIPGFIFCD